MRFVTDEAAAVLSSGGFQHYWVADVFYDGVRRLSDVPLEEVTLSDDDGSAIKGSGSCTIIWQDDFGRSILPEEIGDVFSPFGTEIAIYSMVTSGRLAERIPYGRFEVVDVPQMRDETSFFRGMVISNGSRIELTLKDLLVRVSNDRFDVPSVPSQLDSVYREIANITGLPMSAGVPDGPISRAVPYNEEKLEAVLDLADVLGAVPFMTSTGTVSLRSKLPGAPVGQLKRGENLVDLRRGMSADGVYNTVVFRSTTDQQTQVLARAEVTSGPLRVSNSGGGRSPAGRRPTFRASDFVSTPEQAKTYVDAELRRVARLSAVRWPITMLFNPAYESGDPIEVEDEYGRMQVCQFLSIERKESHSPTQEAVVIRG